MTCATGRLSPVGRLTRPEEFKAVFASGQRSSDSNFIILARPNGMQRPRLGFAIARTRIPGAVQRNRLKRLVREFFRMRGGELGGIDMVVMAQTGADRRDNPVLRISLGKHWKRLAACASS